MMQSTGGSFGLQAGGQSTDFVILVVNDAGARALLKGKLKLGADASIAMTPARYLPEDRGRPLHHRSARDR